MLWTEHSRRYARRENAEEITNEDRPTVKRRPLFPADNFGSVQPFISFRRRRCLDCSLAPVAVPPCDRLAGPFVHFTLRQTAVSIYTTLACLNPSGVCSAV
ncbi:unnamed protein product [Ixodes pacificus]